MPNPYELVKKVQGKVLRYYGESEKPLSPDDTMRMCI